MLPRTILQTTRRFITTMPTPKKLLITRHVGDQGMSLLKTSPHELVIWPEDSAAPREWLLENAKGAEGICVVGMFKVDEELLDAAGESLKVISTFSVGYDHIDVPACRKRGIRIGHTPGVLNDAVADTTVLLVLMAMRRGGEAMAVVRNGEWPKRPWAPFQNTGPALSHPSLTLGFLGFGRISQCVLTRLLAFTCSSPSTPPRALYTSSRRRENQAELDAELSKKFGVEVRYVDKEELARESDVLVILCDLNESTKGLVGKEFLGMMKSTATLVNCARGGVVDTPSLAQALSSGALYAAGLDVVDGEPNVTSSNNPLVNEPRCVIFPHIGSATFDARNGMATLCVENALAVLEGREMPAELKA